MPHWSVLAAPILGFLLSLGGTWLALGWLRRRAILDLPNERSSHSIPTPRGGGVGLLAGLIPAWLLLFPLVQAEDRAAFLAVSAGALVLAVISFLDDRRGLPPLPRFAGQILIIAVVLSLTPSDHLAFQGFLPLWLDRCATGFAWLWFVNLFNFMDGIDGITGVEAASIGVGLALVAWLSGPYLGVGLGLAAAGAALGFLVWNWSPAKLFMGDVGSIPLGLMIGWLLILAAFDGAWAAAVILPLYYWADATITLLRRALRGEKLWRAHRSHFYQRATQAGSSHADVSTAVLTNNLGLIAICALVGVDNPWIGILAAGFLVASLLRRFSQKS
jgi:UDP-N-acetylmuramyl pentapeptide phosphotransferase/UDP-N-acetylglucosamine-1-phosphate transferase